MSTTGSCVRKSSVKATTRRRYTKASMCFRPQRSERMPMTMPAAMLDTPVRPMADDAVMLWKP